MSVDTRPSSKEREVLNHITMIVASGLSPRDLVRSVGMEVRKVIDFDRMSLTLLDPEADTLRVFAVVETDQTRSLSEGTVLAKEDTPLRPVLEDGEPILIRDIRQTDKPIARELREKGIVSFLAYPLEHRRKVIGTLNLASRRADSFSEDQFDLLRQLAGPLAVAMENGKLWEEMRQTVTALERTNEELTRTQGEMLRLLREAKEARRKVEEYSQALEDKVRERTHELTILKDLSDKIVGALDYDDLFRIVLISLYQVANYDVAAALLREGDAHRLIIKRSRPTTRALERQVRDLVMKSCKDLAGLRLRAKDISTSLRRTSRFFDRAPTLEGRIRSYINVPLVSGNDLLGVINISSLKENAFTPDHLRILYTISNQATAAILRLRTLREEEESRLRSMVAGMADGVILLSPEGRITLMNPSADEMMKALSPDQLGRPLTRIGKSTAEDLVGSVLEGALPMVQTEVAPAEGAGSYIVIAFPLKNADGDRVGAAIILRDVTRERSLQEQLVQAEKLSTVGQLVSGVAHELNNPLAGVIGYSQLLLTTECPPEVRSDLEKISREAERARRIVQNLLTFARRHKPEKTEVDVNGIVEDTLDLRAYEMKVNNISLVKDLDPRLPRTMADFHQLQQVILNLVNNAIDAMGEARKGGTITIRTTLAGDRIQMVVSDTGPGIPPEEIRRVFDPFFTTKEVGKGTGLGLSISYGIVQEHGGNLTVEGGDGATFTMELPVIRKDGKTRRRKSSTTRKRRKGSRQRILVADDEETITDLVANLLGKEGHDVDRALSGRKALELLEDRQYDLVVSDIRMPGLGGKDLYRVLTEKSPRMKDRVVFITGDTSNPDTQEFLSETGALHISKPFTLDELNGIVQGALEKAASTTRRKRRG